MKQEDQLVTTAGQAHIRIPSKEQDVKTAKSISIRMKQECHIVCHAMLDIISRLKDKLIVRNAIRCVQNVMDQIRRTVTNVIKMLLIFRAFKERRAIVLKDTFIIRRPLVLVNLVANSADTASTHGPVCPALTIAESSLKTESVNARQVDIMNTLMKKPIEWTV